MPLTGGVRGTRGVEHNVAALAIAAAVILATWSTYGEHLTGALATSGPSTVAKLGGQAPEFSVPAADGGAPLSLADYRGRPVVVNFWATWCPPCRQEMPELQRYQAQADARAVVIGLDLQEDQASVQSLRGERGLSYPIGLDLDGQVGLAYGVSGLPTSVFVDSAGVVRDRAVGPMTYDTLVKRVERLP